MPNLEPIKATMKNLIPLEKKLEMINIIKGIPIKPEAIEAIL